MRKAAVVLFIICFCGAFAQSHRITPEYKALRKNIPLTICNTDTAYFHLLRYNKAAHDITIEQRSKQDGRILKFTALRMDSVNAAWFDYGDLDYLFFNYKKTLYFFFEKVINSRRTLYLKVIDTSGRASGFREIASVENDKGAVRIGLKFGLTVGGDKVLVNTWKIYPNGMIRNTISLFGCEENRTIWTKTLLPENPETDHTGNFSCDNENKLYYIHRKNSFRGIETVYVNGIYAERPIIVTDTVYFARWIPGEDNIQRKILPIGELSAIADISVITKGGRYLVSIFGIKSSDTGGDKQQCFLNFTGTGWDKPAEYAFCYYDSVVAEHLTFYDGPQKYPWTKRYQTKLDLMIGNELYQLSAREETNYQKEILVRKTDPVSGRVTGQKIIPRKLFVQGGGQRFKTISEPMITHWDGKLFLVTLEAPSNFTEDPEDFRYHDFGREENLWNSNVVAYILHGDNRLEKKLVFNNSGFDLVPVRYVVNKSRDMVFYLNSRKLERFLIVDLESF